MSSEPKCGDFYDVASLEVGCSDKQLKPCIGCMFNGDERLKRESGGFTEKSHDGKNENTKEILKPLEIMNKQNVTNLVQKALNNVDLEALEITADRMEYVKAGVRIFAKLIDVEISKLGKGNVSRT